MRYVTTGLPNNGRTQFFDVQYDKDLSQDRGAGLASDFMTHCDADFALLRSWFSGRGLDMAPPIQVTLTTVPMDSDGNPTNPGQDMGARWFGGGPWPLQLTINIGEVAMVAGTPIMLARYFLVSEVSEMFMRAMAPYPQDNWYSFSDEGSQGEGLSRFLAQQFLLKEYPGVAAIPSQRSASFNVTNLWLNSPRINYIDSNPDDNNPDAVTGCQTLFLFYLHDQFGFRIEDVINNGATTLSKVYEKLTQLKLPYIDQNITPPDTWQDAWLKFSTLVNAHYPATVTLRDGAKSAITSMSYMPPLDTVFPVCELDYLVAPPQTSWVASSATNLLSVGLDRQPIVPVPVTFISSDPTIISSLPVLSPPPAAAPSPFTISPPLAGLPVPLAVLPQAPGFRSKSVLLTASYAGKSLTRTVVIVEQGAMGMPPLEIDVDRSTDVCQRFLVENVSQTFRVMNLDVFADQSGLVFSWSVTGAAPDATNTPSLTISALPAAGTTVTISVAVTNAQNLQAAGTLSFQTAVSGFPAMAAELRCRISQIVNSALSLPSWAQVEEGGIPKEQLIGLEKQLSQVAHGTARVTTLSKQMRKFENSLARE